MLESFRYIAKDSIKGQQPSWRNFLSRLFIRSIGQSRCSMEIDELTLEDMEAGLRLYSLGVDTSRSLISNIQRSRVKTEPELLPNSVLVVGDRLPDPLTITTEEEGMTLLLQNTRGKKQTMICLLIHKDGQDCIAEIYSKPVDNVEDPMTEKSRKLLILDLASRHEIKGRIPIPQSSIDDINK